MMCTWKIGLFIFFILMQLTIYLKYIFLSFGGKETGKGTDETNSKIKVLPINDPK